MLPGAKLMIMRERRGVAGPIAIFLGLLLVALVVGAGLLWLKEADARLQAEQATAEVQKKYDDLKTQCDAMKNDGQVGGLSLDGNQGDPMVQGLEKQTDVPACEKPVTQPFAEAMRAQDENFFKEAKEGDALVSYPLSKVVYLYRGSTSTLLNQARIADAPPIQQQEQQPPQPQPQQSQLQPQQQQSPEVPLQPQQARPESEDTGL